MAPLERIPPDEAAQIDTIVRLTLEQMQRRYPGESQVRRGVHAKDHGCVTGALAVRSDLPPELRVGVFAEPGREYGVFVRFSNAALTVAPDSPADKDGATRHGSRGMAVKVLGVAGAPLLPVHGALTQDFLMINQPVFAFANVEDYAALTGVLATDGDDKPDRFFGRIHVKDGQPDLADPVTQRALRTLKIIKRVQSGAAEAYQPPPASPADNRYFSGAPFAFGADRVMKFSARPIDPSAGGAPDVADPDYLRHALHRRLTAPDAQPILFVFEVQVRAAADLAASIDSDIEDACFEWDEQKYPFVPVGTITIPPQDFEAAEQRALCETLTFTPWHGLAEHRPLGGINRLRRAVYEASTQFRHLPKEPAALPAGAPLA